MWKFSVQEGKRTTPISCIYAIGVPTSILIAYYRCGVLYRLFLYESFHNLRLDKRNHLHTFFLYTNPPHRRRYGNKNLNYHEKIASPIFCISAYTDWSHGTAYFKGDKPSKCISVGGVIIWYNGELTCIGSSGTTELYRGTGDICVAYPKGYTGYQFKFDTPGRVQIQYLR